MGSVFVLCTFVLEAELRFQSGEWFEIACTNYRHGEEACCKTFLLLSFFLSRLGLKFGLPLSLSVAGAPIGTQIIFPKKWRYVSGFIQMGKRAPTR